MNYRRISKSGIQSDQIIINYKIRSEIILELVAVLCHASGVF